MGKRSTARKLAMQAIYQYMIQKENQDEILEYTLTKDNYIEATREFASDIYYGVFQHQDVIDKLITEYSIDWKLNRIAMIDRSILYVSIWEMLFTDTSLKVIIAEAIEIIRKYSAFEAIKFINGILGGIGKNRETLKKQVHKDSCLQES